ncbi:6224_t:CDS:2 [Ambispora leptoticha]|uniref:6224_t:CDS:1 n=1 Tax=Ambispora leptoticha TaxID=144679 RepID=A0A9N8WB28_9GLOM|nr:6224_t:CDS:2 [Ambispora leptoticha]
MHLFLESIGVIDTTATNTSISNDTLPTISPITDEQYATMAFVTLLVLIFSILASVLVIVIYFIMKKYYPGVSDRATFRLGVLICTADLFYSLTQVIGLNIRHPGISCGFTVWAYVFFALLSIFFSDCIAIHLQVLFIHKYKGKRNLERYYICGAIIFAFLLSLLPLIDQMYGWDAPERTCFYRHSGQLIDIVWQWATLSLWIGLSILYCTGVLIVVIIKLRKRKRANSSPKTTSIDSISLTTPSLIGFKHTRPKTPDKLISVVARKVTLYPIIPFITQTPKFLVETIAFSRHQMFYELLFISFIGCAIQGLLNAIVFAQDVAVSRGRFALRIYLWRKYVNEYESRYPHRASCHKKKNSDIELSTISTVKNSPGDICIEQHENKNDVFSSIMKRRQSSMWEPTFLERLKYQIIIRCVSAPKIKESSRENSFGNERLPRQINAMPTATRKEKYFDIPYIKTLDTSPDENVNNMNREYEYQLKIQQKFEENKNNFVKTNENHNRDILTTSLPHIPSPTLASSSSSNRAIHPWIKQWSHDNDLELNNFLDESEGNELDYVPISSSALIFPNSFNTNKKNTNYNNENVSGP